MDEDVEFRDMVLKKLEENGSLLEIKAKLRAYLYDVIENDGKMTEAVNDNDLTYNSGDKSDLDDDEPEEQEMDGRTLALGLVFDLLDCLKLPYTKQVLSAETGVKRPCPRVRLKKEFLRQTSTDDADLGGEAILLQLIEQIRTVQSSSGGTSEVSQVSREITESKTVTEDAVEGDSAITT
ncbi:uncharacterized protein LOC135697406 [Ochlerotatus camptorhynchus]|uniref:uncharacterized protein LOC135697406 n=1 Tax=Ochlerotatus camptorhynchus TaxID=644619 RepID=UPI0031DA2325